MCENILIFPWSHWHPVFSQLKTRSGLFHIDLMRSVWLTFDTFIQLTTVNVIDFTCGTLFHILPQLICDKALKKKKTRQMLYLSAQICVSYDLEIWSWPWASSQKWSPIRFLIIIIFLESIIIPFYFNW